MVAIPEKIKHYLSKDVDIVTNFKAIDFIFPKFEDLLGFFKAL